MSNSFWVKSDYMLPRPNIPVLGYWDEGGENAESKYNIVYIRRKRRHADYWVSDLSANPKLIWSINEISWWMLLPKDPNELINILF